jgi:hypothetical protein
MRTFRIVAVLALTVAGTLSRPVLADENQKTPTPTVSATAPLPVVQVTAAEVPVVEPAKAVEEPVKEAITEPVKEAVKEPVKEPAKKPAAPPSTSLQLKVGDATVRFGLLMQPQADLQQNLAGGYGQNLLIRRARFLIGGQVTKTVFFFYETENSRLGAATASGAKVMNSGFQTLDATVEWRPRKTLNISGGLIRVPTSRDGLESASSEFTLDFNSYAFMATTALGGTGGRDTGVMARGYFLNDRLEYRAAVVSGLRETGNRNSIRKAARLQYNFFDKEVYNFPSYAGSNFGAKKIVAIGAAIDSQVGYTGWTTDLFADIPTSFGSALGTVTYQNVEGGTRSPAGLATQQIFAIDGGVFFKKLKIGPWARYEQRTFETQTARDESRFIVGLNYYPMGNNFNIKAGLSRLKPAAGREMNQFTLQLQVYYF